MGFELRRNLPEGLSIEDARKAMIEAGEAPLGYAAPKAKAADVQPNTAVADALIADAFGDDEAGQPEAPAPRQPKVERIEAAKFYAELRQEGSGWVGEIVYKNGSGTEKFTAPTKDALMLKLLEGKGNATLRVKEAVRREKLRTSQPDPEPDYSHIKDEASRKAAAKADIVQAAVAFRDSHPEYKATQENWSEIQRVLNEHGWYPTLKNLEMAYLEAKDDGLVDLADIEAPQTKEVKRAPQPNAAPTGAAVKVEDSPNAVVRKRGQSSLKPSQSSGTDGLTQDKKELSEAELRSLSTKELRRIASEDRMRRRGNR